MATKGKELSLWDILNGAMPPDKELLAKQLAYMLRKWACFAILNAVEREEGEPKQEVRRWHVVFTRSGPKLYPPGEWDEDDDDDGGSSVWTILDDGEFLITSRPECITAEFAGLGEFRIVVDKMIEIAAKNGMEQVNLLGYGADMGWVSVEKHNLQAGKEELVVVNYGPNEEHVVVYEKYLAELAQQLRPGGGATA